MVGPHALGFGLEGQGAQAVVAVQSILILVIAGDLGFDKFFQPFQLGQAQAGLDVGHAVVIAHLVVEELQHIALGLGGQVLGVFRPVGMVGNQHAARTGGDDLVAVEAVTARIAHGAGEFACQRAGDVLVPRPRWRPR